MTSYKLQELQQIRAAWITPVLGVEGNLLYFEPILKRLSAEFADFCIFTAEYKGEQHDDLCIKVSGSLKRLYTSTRIDPRQLDKNLTGVSVYTPGIISELMKWKPDIVIVNEFSLFSFYAMIAAKLTGAGLLHIVEARPRFRSGKLVSLARRLFRMLMIKRADAILTNNVEGHDYIKDELKASPKRIITRPYLVSSIPEDVARRTRLPYAKRERDGHVHFLYVGWLTKQKGLHHALQAFDRLASPYRDRFRFELVGDGPYKAELEKLSAELGISDRVIFHGRQPYDELGEFYAGADVFLFPSLNDYRALAPFEALAYGLPVLGSVHNGGVHESTVDDYNGYVFTPENVDELTFILTRMIENTDLIDRFAVVSSKMATRYTLDSAIASLIEACNATGNE